MRIALQLSRLLVSRVPMLSFLWMIGVAILTTSFWVLSSIQDEVQTTILNSDRLIWVVASFSDPASAEKFSKDFPKSKIISEDAVTNLLGGVDPQFKETLLGLGDEAKTLVPTLVSMQGVFNAETLNSMRRAQGLLKLDEKKPVQAKLIHFYERLSKEVFTARFALILVLALLIALLSRILMREFQSIALSLEHWGVPASRVRLPVWFSVVLLLGIAQIFSAAGWMALFSHPERLSILGDLSLHENFGFSWASGFFLIALEAVMAVVLTTFRKRGI